MSKPSTSDPQPTFFTVLLAILISEFGSNLAAVGVVVPIVISICHGSGIDPVLPALAATLGPVPITRMVRSGIVFDVIAAVVVTLAVTLTGRLFGVV